MKNGFANVVIALAAIALGVSLSMRPWRVYAQQKSSTQLRLQELRRIEQAHIKDLEQEAKLGSNVGREGLARAQGWRKKDEVPAGN